MTIIGHRWMAIVAAVMVATATLPAYADTAELLPDLRQAPVGCPGGFGGNPATCRDWDVCAVVDATAPNGECVTTGAAQAVRLRFTTSEDNVGEGPLLLYGKRENAGQVTMAVRQAFQSRVDGKIPDSFEAAQRSTGASAYYEPAKMHQHWHLMRFERFELRTPRGDTLVTDRKNGFCLGDRYPLADADRLPRAVVRNNSPQGILARFLEKNQCNHHGPDAMTVTQGISVGRGDDYRFDVDFQWLDITGVPSGTYDVVNTANVDRALREINYDNNSSSIAISVQWSGGAQGEPGKTAVRPKVVLLRSCPGRASCADAPAG